LRQPTKGTVLQAAQELLEPVTLRSLPFLSAHEEGSRTVLKILRARLFASPWIGRSWASLRMTGWDRFAAAYSTPPQKHPDHNKKAFCFRFVAKG
jgi:hypothetical protein